MNTRVWLTELSRSVGRLAKLGSGQQKMRIHGGKEKPTNPSAAVHCREHGFWGDDGDLQTKRTLTAVMFFFTLTENGGSEKLPLINVPTQ